MSRSHASLNRSIKVPRVGNFARARRPAGNLLLAMSDVEMDDAAGTSGQKEEKKDQRFTVKKWNAVALWAWGTLRARVADGKRSRREGAATRALLAGRVVRALVATAHMGHAPSPHQLTGSAGVVRAQTSRSTTAPSAATTSWTFASSARPTSRLPRATSARSHGACATTPSTFTVSRAGCERAAYVPIDTAASASPHRARRPPARAPRLRR